MTNKPSGIDLQYKDDSVKPGDDFYRFINGKWLDTHEIPADRSKDGGMYTLRDEAEKNVREIIEKISAEQPGSRIGALYNAFMDTEKINKDAAAPLLAEVQPIAAAADREALLQLVAEADRSGVSTPFGWYTSIDAKNPEVYVVYLSQSGLGLPDESYYREDKYEEIRAAYTKHIARMFEMTNLAEPFGVSADEAAQRIMAFETELASHHWDKVTLRDADKRYNPYAASSLNESFPGFDFSAWITALGSSVEDFATVVVGQPSYFEAAAKIWKNGSLEDWKLYLAWATIRARAPYLHDELVQANFDFYGKTLSGTEELRERWKRGVSVIESNLGEELGKEYVAVHFPPEHKAKMMALVENLLEAYRRSITELDWMTDATRERALEKLSKFVTKIGYPDRWRDYSALELVEGDLLENLRRCSLFEHNFMLGRIGKPVDEHEWLMSPQTVNAYYMPPANEIVFPAAILQAPYFDPDADDAANYGGIGSVIGHEIGHGFDDQGSKYDGTGALNNWWTDEDRAEFSARTANLVKQYSAYTPAGLDPENYKVNGELTLGENIGDLGGLSIALRAYKIALEEQGLDLESAPVIDGLTAAQRIFLAWAAGWRTKSRPQHAQMMLSVDPHSPDEFRVNGVVRNVDEWYSAFDISEDDALYLAPEERVKIWV
ncbi:M13 family metallopeptidase [Rothia aerolata]|uniref:Peptidase M13 n=1 Tax=Rothia aerolata TaxID=1812262 RepID=A0A917IZ07_9MICC|nr:M13-type metalloendopeptidase [Rothia aerolata]GGH66863.1 peptidase M13 [Rothia aerolata]